MIDQYECQRCGGRLLPNADGHTATCESCGCLVTIPKATASLFNQANKLRLQNEFDKAEPLFRNIIAENPEDSEAYWNLLLCRYGIEYVKDPETNEQKPTCHRMQLSSILEDEDYKKALLYADGFSKNLYQHCAKEIDTVLKAAIQKSSVQKTYDIFICFKDRDDVTHLRTEDSVIGQNIYNILTEQGYSVFFSRVTLQGVLGEEYEPLIFAALQSARVMLVVGTRREYMEAVWVKNEWGRFIPLMEQDKRSRALFVAYQNMRAEDIPAQMRLMPRINVKEPGYEQELLKGIKSIVGGRTTSTTMLDFQQDLLNKGRQHLEKEDWPRAKIYFEQVLDLDSQNGWAWWGLALAESHHFDGYSISANVQQLIDKASESEDLSLHEEMQVSLQSFRDKVAAHNRELQQSDFSCAWKELNRLTHSGKFYHPDAVTMLNRLHGIVENGTDMQKSDLQQFEEVYKLAQNAKENFDRDTADMPGFLQKFCSKSDSNAKKYRTLDSLHRRAVACNEAFANCKWRGSVLVAIALVVWAITLLVATEPLGQKFAYNAESRTYSRDGLISVQLVLSTAFVAITFAFAAIHRQIKDRHASINWVWGALLVAGVAVAIFKFIEMYLVINKLTQTPRELFDYCQTRNIFLLCCSIAYLIFSTYSFVNYFKCKYAYNSSRMQYFAHLSNTSVLQDSINNLNEQYGGHLPSEMLDIDPEDAYPEYYEV